MNTELLESESSKSHFSLPQQEYSSTKPDKNEIEVNLSKLQQHISEIFRISLCRNDDYNLVLSSMLKKQKKNMDNKDKMVIDLRNREDDRQARESDILKELQNQTKGLFQIEKHLRKMIRKSLLLSVDALQHTQNEQVKTILTEKFPSYLHVASIMNERTQEEKSNFGKVDFTELKGKSSNQFLTEDKIDWLLDTYIRNLKQPYELVVKTVDRSRERFLREFAKFEALFEQKKFFTEEGVKERKEKIKLKVLMNSLYGPTKESKDKSDMFGNIPQEEQILRMLQIHNSKVDKIIKEFKNGYDQRKQAIEDGIPIQKPKYQPKPKKSDSQLSDKIKKPKVTDKKATKKKAKKEVEVTIKIKGQDGNVQTYEDGHNTSSSVSEKENQDEQLAKKSIKKKKKVSTKNTDVIQSEQTLQMLKNVLKPSSKPKKTLKSKKSDTKLEEVKEKKPVSKAKKVTKETKKPNDTMSRFFNAYGESPHLQAIEDSYLKYLEAQYAKESHLKLVKKFQIMYALKKIQRFWKMKYAEIKEKCVIKIQNQIRRHLFYLGFRKLRLEQVKISLRMIKLKDFLKLYIKKRRMNKLPFDRTQKIPLKNVLKIQGLIRQIIARKTCNFMKFIKQLRFKQKLIKHFKEQAIVQKLNRENETYYLQRYSLAKIELDSIVKYLQQAEQKFDSNWQNYESSLEKYLTTDKQYKDWVNKKDDFGNVFWINLKTLKEQKEHPGKQIYLANKKILKAKAEEELRENFRPIYERRTKILETLELIKSKVYEELRDARQSKTNQ